MTTTPTSPERPTRRKAWVFVFSVGAMALLVAGIALWVRQRAAAGRAQIELRLDAIRAVGEPVTIADFRRRYPLPAPENDALKRLAPALSGLVIPDFDEGVPLFGPAPLPPAIEPLEPALKARMIAFARTNSGSIKSVCAVNIDGAWFAEGVTDHLVFATTPNIIALEKLPSLLLLSAVVSAEQGQTDTAVEQLQQALSIGRCFRTGLPRHHILMRSVEQSACGVLERIVNRAPVSETSSLGLTRKLAAENPQSIREGWLGLRCVSIRQLEQLRADPVGSLMMQEVAPVGWIGRVKSRAMAQWISLSRHGYRDEDFAAILDAWNAVSQALDSTPRQRRVELNNLSAMIRQKWRSRSVAWGTVILPDVLLSRIDHDGEVISRLRTARVAMAILRWRAAHEGKLPESLSELVPDTLPAIPVDPFDEQPLRYRRLPQGFTVYSVGPDFTDNGGQRQPAGTEKADGYDVVFSVGR